MGVAGSVLVYSSGALLRDALREVQLRVALPAAMVVVVATVDAPGQVPTRLPCASKICPEPMTAGAPMSTE